MPNPYGANQYRQTSITTASRGRVLIMLYEAALRNVKKASECIDKKDIPGKGTAIGKVHDIINELLCSLNHEVAGDIAKQLESLYTFIIGELLKANLENSKEKLASVQRVLETLLEGWRGAVEEFEKGEKK